MEGFLAAGMAALLVAALTFLLQGIGRVETRERRGWYSGERREAE